MYGDLAWTWPIVSRPEHYAREAERFLQLTRQYAHLEVNTVLDLGCGGGHNDWTLKRDVQVTGVDVSEHMLALARKLNPQVEYIAGDMRSVRLGRAFDAVMAADAIDYMLTEQDLCAAFGTAYVHLKPGGVFCTYAEVTRENWQQNETHASLRTLGDVEIVFIENRYDPNPADTTYEHTFVYLIRSDGELTIETDRHSGGIFPLERWRQLLRKVGFSVLPTKVDDEGIPWLVGVKPGADTDAPA